MNDFRLPDEEQAARVAQIIVDTISKHSGSEPYGGGCRAFYTPAEWKARNERYGCDSVLIVCHDGGDAARFFNVDYECYEAFETMNKALEAAGYVPEACTAWYTAIYPKE